MAEPIQLHVDLEVDAAQEAVMVQNFRTVFRPVITQQPGFVEVKLLKLRAALKGAAPANANYRLVISFQTEEDRLKWVAADVHQEVWPSIANTLVGEKFSAILYGVQ